MCIFDKVHRYEQCNDVFCLQMNLRAATGSASRVPGDTMEKTIVATCLTKLVNVSAAFTYIIAHRSYVL